LDSIDRIVGAVVSDNPRKDGERVLAHLAITHRARSAALLVCHCERLKPMATHGSSDELVASVTALWTAQGAALERGEPVTSGSVRLVPLRTDGALVGVIAIATSQPLDPLLVGSVERPLLRTIQTWRAVALSYVCATSPDAFLREKLVYHLTHCDWKIARVAKIMNVTRNTIYSWLTKYRITRPKAGRSAPRPRTQE
jgi:hypothetical protein